MPTFDIISEVDKHELHNAVEQSSKEILNRFDFKGVQASFALDDLTITLMAESDFQLKQMRDILLQKAVKRGIDAKSLEIKDAELNHKQVRQRIVAQQGIDSTLAKKIVKSIKDKKMKIQASIQGEKVRVSGKKRDDLQTAIAFLKEGEWNQPLQFENFRD